MPMDMQSQFVLPKGSSHQYLSVSNFLENEDSDSSTESVPHDLFGRLRARLCSHPRATQRLVTASTALVSLVLVVVTLSRIAGPTGEAVSPQPADGNPQLRAVQLNQAVLGAATSLLKPAEHMHDGNVCDEHEEFYGGLCYKKCSLLTDGEAPIRTSSWTCCKSHPCGLANQRGGIVGHIVCSGYDISGSGGCPHKPGACLVDEELHLGICYKKCAILTAGEFAHRVAAATCCKTTGLGCLDIRNDKTSKAFNVGGGAHDNDPSTPSEAHPPQESLTESAASPGNRESPDTATQVAASPQHLPAESLHNEKSCNDNEELYGGLCYKKCDLLTNGQASVRTSSWTCCEAHPCTIFNQHGSVGKTVLCNGFDVSGDGHCPHKPGACLVDEEMHLGVCYKKCAILTHGDYPHRFAAATCCKAKGLGCLNPRNDLTRGAFAVGGGDEAFSEESLVPDQRSSGIVDGEVTALTPA